VGGGLIFEYAISLPPKVYVSATYTSKVHVYIRTQLQKHSTQNSWCRIESTVRGHHIYKASWSPYIGEELTVQRKVNNIHDDYAVAILKNSNTVGHVPQSLLVLPTQEWQWVTCIVNGDMRRSEVDGKGLVVPCVNFKGKQKRLERLIKLFAKQAKLGTSNWLFYVKAKTYKRFTILSTLAT